MPVMTKSEYREWLRRRREGDGWREQD